MSMSRRCGRHFSPMLQRIRKCHRALSLCTSLHSVYLLSSSPVPLGAPSFKLAQKQRTPSVCNKEEEKKPAGHANLLLNAPANGSVFFDFCLFARKNPICICSSDATKLVERVEFYCNGKELRAAPRQNPRICARAACSMHCAYIGHTFLARNHIMPSLLKGAFWGLLPFFLDPRWFVADIKSDLKQIFWPAGDWLTSTRRTGGGPLVLNSEMGVLWAGLCAI
jgi:hypothetical protein